MSKRFKEFEEFEEWLKSHVIKTIGYLNNVTAYEAGAKEGWRAALEWVKTLTQTCPKGEDCEDYIIKFIDFAQQEIE